VTILFGKKIVIDYQVVMFAKQIPPVRCCRILLRKCCQSISALDQAEKELEKIF
jgi:hypothetical protein